MDSPIPLIAVILMSCAAAWFTRKVLQDEWVRNVAKGGWTPLVRLLSLFRLPSSSGFEWIDSSGELTMVDRRNAHFERDRHVAGEGRGQVQGFRPAGYPNDRYVLPFSHILAHNVSRASIYGVIDALLGLQWILTRSEGAVRIGTCAYPSDSTEQLTDQASRVP